MKSRAATIITAKLILQPHEKKIEKLDQLIDQAQASVIKPV